MSQRVVIQDAVLAFPNLFTPKAAQQGGSERYSASVLIDPEAQADQVQRVRDAMWAEAQAFWGNKAQAAWKTMVSDPTRLALRDGDTKAEYTGFEGMMFVSANRQKNQGPPKVIDRAKQPVDEADGLIYAGCRANVSFDVYSQDKQGIGKRINAGLVAVQWVGHGEPLGGGGVPSDEDFEELEPVSDTEGGDPLA